ncbi:uncharacterized protein LOC110973552 [Acanthaster planci]|uniref:Uncharacterized protein LOC110973552 n=1 Tax=Acanthaster planci TaxID=133434 RepID=A0A8B7XJK9_ACAPL|nr:uncharacterized protein LOC110973552 [Acanthaster planci]
MFSPATPKSALTLGETPYRTLPNFYRTTIQLSTLLDVEQPLGNNDYRTVLEQLGFQPEEVRFWGCKCKRPTLEALVGWEGTVRELADALRECERYDALSVLVQSLVQVLQEAHRVQRADQTGANILSRDVFSSTSSPELQPSSLRWEDADTCLKPIVPEYKQSSDVVDDATSLASSSSLSLLPPSSLIQTLSSDSSVFGRVTTELPSLESLDTTSGLSSPGVCTVESPSTLPRIPDVEALLTAQFEFPTQLAVTCLSSSKGRKTTEFVCNLVASGVSRWRCISNSGDLTWISNTTVYINNFARLLLLLVAFLNAVTCVFGTAHTPAYVLELIIAAVPVAQSLYVDQNLPTYRDLIRKIKEVEAGMALIARTLERRPGECLTSEGNKLAELDARRKKLEHLKRLVWPVYSDIRLCIISTLLVEFLLVFLVLFVGLICFSSEEILAKLGDGFTMMALALMCIDCAYNFAIVAVYYHDRTIETVLRKDRFRVNAALLRNESDSV